MFIVMLKWHIGALLLGVLLDLIIGDPEWLPHPIRWIGKMIADFDSRWNLPELTDEEKEERGRRMVVSVILITAVYTAVILVAAYILHPALGILVEGIITAYMLAAHSLAKESGMVKKALTRGTIEDGRYAVSRIVGRETANLSEDGVIRAAVETVAENTSDGVIAPLLYLLLGGPILGCVYKAVNTMDSMVGYKSEKYLHFGRAAAKTDDVLNYIPARLTAGLLIIAAFLHPSCSGRRAWKVIRRDAGRSTSPNSGHPEAAVAGALGVSLLGDAVYHGKTVKKPKIGDPVREIERQDISRSHHLMFTGEGLIVCLILAGFILLLAG